MKIRRYALKSGSLKNMLIREENLPAPAAGEVQVSVKAIGLNFADVFAIWGLYKAAPKTEYTPGLEYSGIVEATGAGVTHLKPGDRVMGVTRFGGYATGLNIDARYVIPLPAGWDFPTGASYLVQTLTAYYGMSMLGELKKGQTVLIHSVAGGVGLQALKIAKSLGCFVIGTVGNPSKTKLALETGCDRVIVRGGQFEQELRNALGDRPLNLVLDTVGGRYFSIPFRMMAPMGRMIVIGSSRYASVGNRPNVFHMLKHFLTRPKIDPQSLPEENKGLFGFNLIYLYERAELMHQLLQELNGLNLAPPHVGHVFPFERMHDAIRLFQSGKTMGKVVVSVETRPIDQ
ncbi:MAG: zinc-binding dehydrogenase [Lewinellaceae bacterium]|nr:zinc-binding dehydrogenase [Lewinellaceae bacterium]